MPGRYVADTPLARFLIEQFGENLNLSEIERRSTAAGYKLLASSLSRYLNGDENVSTETVRRLSGFTGVPEADIRALLPADSRAARPLDDESPAWARALLAEWERVRAGTVVLQTAHAGPTPAVARAEAVRGVLEAEGYRGLLPVEVDGDDLVDRRPPVVAGMVLWLDPLIPPAPGCVVGVRVGGELLLRTLGPDGRTLTSAVPGRPPLALDAVEVVGVGRLAQVPL